MLEYWNDGMMKKRRIQPVQGAAHSAEVASATKAGRDKAIHESASKSISDCRLL
jgi:hypothetical protein